MALYNRLNGLRIKINFYYENERKKKFYLREVFRSFS